MASFLKQYRPFWIGLTLFVAVFGVVECARGSDSTDLAGLNPIRQTTGFVQSSMNAALGTMFAFWGDRARDDKVDSLEKKVAKLREEKTRLIGVLQENIRLRKLLDFKKKHPNYSMVSGEVIGRDITPYFRVLSVRIKTTEPVKSDMPVVSYGGVVGRVTSVSGRYADVMLVSDPRSRIDAVTQRNRALGIVEGLGHSRHYRSKIAYLKQKDEVRKGDVLVTTGTGGIFPRELRIGRVTEVKDKKQDLFQKALLEPAVDFGRLREVFVITGTSNE